MAGLCISEELAIPGRGLSPVSTWPSEHATYTRLVSNDRAIIRCILLHKVLSCLLTLSFHRVVAVSL